MVLQKIKIRNVKKLKDVEKDLDGASLIIYGENALGKSTFLSCIEAVTGNKDALKEPVISHGETSGYVQAEVTGADGEKYTLILDLNKGKEPKLSMKPENGAKEIRVGVIASVLGASSFDFESFVKLAESKAGKKDQVRIFKEFMTPEELEILETSEKKLSEAYEKRTSIGRDADAIKGLLETSEIHESDFEKYKEKVDLIPIQTELEAIHKHNSERIRISDGIENRKNLITSTDAEIEKLQRQITDLVQKGKALSKEIEGGEKWLENNPEKSDADIKGSLNDVYEFNSKSEAVKNLKAQKEKFDALNSTYEDLTVFIDSAREEISLVVRECGPKIDGLEFQGDELLFKGMPVRGGVMSTSELIRLAYKMKAAKTKGPICIERAESLGQDSFKAILEEAKAEGRQVIMENVMRGATEIVFEKY